MLGQRSGRIILGNPEAGNATVIRLLQQPKGGAGYCDSLDILLQWNSAPFTAGDAIPLSIQIKGASFVIRAFLSRFEIPRPRPNSIFNRKDGVATYLRINVADRNPAEVLEFKRMQREIMNREVDARDMQAAEHYFKLINNLVQKLNSNSADLAVLRWRDKVLDVRHHVEFKGVEFKRNDDGQEEVVEVYPAETGKSGGERQKLTVICLAAALRYQLGGKDSDYPRYAPVILDEAFDKADSEFTDIALTVFKDFHFQLVIATPEKSVMTLDPYVGGTTYVSCRNRGSSSVLSVVYDSKTGEIKPRGCKAGEV